MWFKILLGYLFLLAFVSGSNRQINKSKGLQVSESTRKITRKRGRVQENDDDTQSKDDVQEPYLKLVKIEEENALPLDDVKEHAAFNIFGNHYDFAKHLIKRGPKLQKEGKQTTYVLYNQELKNLSELVVARENADSLIKKMMMNELDPLENQLREEEVTLNELRNQIELDEKERQKKLLLENGYDELKIEEEHLIKNINVLREEMGNYESGLARRDAENIKSLQITVDSFSQKISVLKANQQKEMHEALKNKTVREIQTICQTHKDLIGKLEENHKKALLELEQANQFSVCSIKEQRERDLKRNMHKTQWEFLMNKLGDIKERQKMLMNDVLNKTKPENGNQLRLQLLTDTRNSARDALEKAKGKWNELVCEQLESSQIIIRNAINKLMKYEEPFENIAARLDRFKGHSSAVEEGLSRKNTVQKEIVPQIEYYQHIDCNIDVNNLLKKDSSNLHGHSTNNNPLSQGKTDY